jgi:BirA family transcriptional regulator, biotin operon repressor / biotin---[acetyl-CoA-carboxylase] ligase
VRTKWGSVEAIWAQLVPVLPGFTVEVLPEIDSTNTELMRRAKAGQTDPILLVTEHQTAGRGRLGRTWHDAGARTTSPDLMFSLGLTLAPPDWSGLSLAVGVSAAQSLHPDLRLKWPNDLWLNQRKLAGILIETASLAEQPGRFVVIGVGINISPRDPQGLATPPACLQELLPDLDAADALLRLAAPLVTAVKQFEQLGFAPFQHIFNTLDALCGSEVVTIGGDRVEGVARGVDALGALLVQGEQGVVKISSSEVSVRPKGVLTAPAN